jgi:CheY-like chemotaxis protein
MLTHKTGGLTGARVLIVEDEAIIAMDIQAILEEDGATVAGCASTLSEALNLAKRLDISAAILDICIGRDSATSIAHILRERGVPFVFYSGQGATDPRRLEWKDVPLLSKPATARQLCEAVARLLPG